MIKFLVYVIWSSQSFLMSILKSTAESFFIITPVALSFISEADKGLVTKAHTSKTNNPNEIKRFIILFSFQEVNRKQRFVVKIKIYLRRTILVRLSVFRICLPWRTFSITSSITSAVFLEFAPTAPWCSQ